MTYYKQSLSDLDHIDATLRTKSEKTIFPDAPLQAVLIKTFEKIAKSTHIKYYTFQYRVIEKGKYENKMFFHNLYLENSPKAKAYAEKILKQMQLATDKSEIRELEDMANIPITLHISLSGVGDDRENSLWGIGKILPETRTSSSASEDLVRDPIRQTIENTFSGAPHAPIEIKECDDIPF